MRLRRDPTPGRNRVGGYSPTDGPKVAPVTGPPKPGGTRSASPREPMSAERERNLRRWHERTHPEMLTASGRECEICVLLAQLVFERERTKPFYDVDNECEKCGNKKGWTLVEHVDNHPGWKCVHCQWWNWL